MDCGSGRNQREKRPQKDGLYKLSCSDSRERISCGETHTVPQRYSGVETIRIFSFPTTKQKVWGISTSEPNFSSHNAWINVIYDTLMLNYQQLIMSMIFLCTTHNISLSITKTHSYIKSSVHELLALVNNSFVFFLSPFLKFQVKNRWQGCIYF